METQCEVVVGGGGQRRVGATVDPAGPSLP